MMGDNAMTSSEITGRTPAAERPPRVPATAPVRSAKPEKARRRLPWLDNQTAAEVDAIVEALASTQPEVLAVIVFGSMARHDERPLTNPEPSDVDLLIVVTPGLAEEAAVAIHDTIGMAGQPFGYTPRTIEP